MGLMGNQPEPIVGVKREDMDKHVDLVWHVARAMKSRLPNCVEVDDLVGYGTFGLARAVRDFKPEKGVRFATYAAFRIRGAMLDGLRQEDWVPRLVRVRGEQATGVVSLNRKWFETETGRAVDEAQMLADRSVEVPGEKMAQDELVNGILKGLPYRHREAVRLYFVEEMTMKEVGRHMKFSESRVSQMIAQAIAILREPITQGHLPEVCIEKPPADPTSFRIRGAAKGTLRCREFPGTMFTVQDAAVTAGCSLGTIHNGLRLKRRVGKMNLFFWKASEPEPEKVKERWKREAVAA